MKWVEYAEMSGAVSDNGKLSHRKWEQYSVAQHCTLLQARWTPASALEGSFGNIVWKPQGFRVAHPSIFAVPDDYY